MCVCIYICIIYSPAGSEETLSLPLRLLYIYVCVCIYAHTHKCVCVCVHLCMWQCACVCVPIFYNKLVIPFNDSHFPVPPTHPHNPTRLESVCVCMYMYSRVVLTLTSKCSPCSNCLIRCIRGANLQASTVYPICTIQVKDQLSFPSLAEDNNQAREEKQNGSFPDHGTAKLATPRHASTSKSVH